MAADTTSPAPTAALSRRTIAIVFGLLCAVLIAGYAFFLRTDYAVVYTGLKPGDAAAIVAQLEAKGVPHRLRDDGTTILVPTEQADSVRLAVAGSDLPLKGAVGFELFNKSDMGLTDFAQKINYQRALQGELTRSIMMMEGVEAARVHLAMPERSLFRAERSAPKAAVEVVAKLGSVLGEDRVRGIRQLVASAVPDLAVADVSVLDGDGRVVSRSIDDTATSPIGELGEQAAAQAYYAARARAALASSLPGAQFAVHVLVGQATPTEGPARPADPPTASASAARTFPMRITIVSAAPLNGEEQGIARDAVAAAVGLSEPLGDTLAFQVGPTNPVASPTTPIPAVTASAVPVLPAADAPALPWTVPLSWFVIGGVILIAAIGWSIGRGRGLSPHERDAFVARLRARIGREGGSDARA